MTITTAYAAGAASTARTVARFGSLRGDLTTLQTQISTGQKAQTYAGLGTGARTSLAVQTQLSTLGSYASNVADAQARISLMGTGLGSLNTLSNAVKTSLASGYQLTTIGQTAAQLQASSGLSQVVDTLNQQADNRYLFSGRSTDTAPVASADAILNGDATHAGLKTVIGQRQAADLGTSGLGRLTLSTTGSTTTLSEDGANLPFGLKIASASSSSAAVTASATTSPSPASVGITVASQPASGDTISVGLTLPDGTSQTVTLTAGGAAATGSYAIGATTADTAQNIRSALSDAITAIGQTTLSSASALKAAGDFFQTPPTRVAGSAPYGNATATTTGTSADTVIWYTGDDAATPRDTATVRIGDNQTVSLGAQANEPAFRSLLTGLGALAAGSFPTTDTTSQARYEALADRVNATLSGTPGTQSLEDISGDLSVASSTLKDASSTLSARTNQLKDTLGAIDDADPDEAGAELLALQTRLQATYQTTSIVLKASLTQYLT